MEFEYVHWNMEQEALLKETAMRLGIHVRRLSSWVHEFHQSGDICAVSRVSSVFIDSIGKLNIFAQMELLGKLQMYCFWSTFIAKEAILR